MAVEKAALLYNAFTTLLILLAFPRMDHPGQMIVERVLIAGGTLLLARLSRLYPCRLMGGLRAAVQLLLLSYWYPDTYEFNRLLPNLDHVFASAEQWLFGCQPAVLFSERLPQRWVSELLNLGYVSYYPLIGLTVFSSLLFYFHRFEETVFTITASFFIFYLIFLFVPVAGPQYYYPAIGLDNVAAGIFPPVNDYFNFHQELLPGPDGGDGFFYNLVDISQQVGERPTAAFPSSHVGLSTILMIMAWRDCRPLFFILLPFYLLLCLATVYIQAHYLIDAIVGFVFSFAVYALVTRLYHRLFAREVYG